MTSLPNHPSHLGIHNSRVAVLNLRLSTDWLHPCCSLTYIPKFQRERFETEWPVCVIHDNAVYMN